MIVDLEKLVDFVRKIGNGDRKNMETSQLEIENHGLLCTMDDTGDSRIQWNKSDPLQIAKAQSRFNELKKKGYLAYSVNKKGDQGVVLSDFDPNAERIIMHSQMIGG